MLDAHRLAIVSTPSAQKEERPSSRHYACYLPMQGQDMLSQGAHDGIFFSPNERPEGRIAISGENYHEMGSPRGVRGETICM